MSGIVGMVNFDGCPVDAALLRRLTGQLNRWGTEQQQCAITENAGFGFVPLKTTEDGACIEQPLSFDGNVHIVADARIDGRAELMADLGRGGRRVRPGASDVELVLHAYSVWGRDCIHHLLGDFAFAIWDADHRELFCARDHFGVKPFFYLEKGNAVVFANSLDVVRVHPLADVELNELAISDFLLFGINQANDTTAFKAIRRLPPAHVLWRTANGASSTSAFWSLPVDGAVRYRRQSDYVEHFKELFELAIADRVRGGCVGVSMSGGLDSTSVAAVAHEILSKDGSDPDMRLCTNVYERLVPDDEGYYAGQVARFLGVPIHLERADDAEIHSGWHQPGVKLSEPVENFESAGPSEAYREFMAGCPILLTGFGGDPALAPPQAYVLERLRRGELSELIRGIWACMRTHGHRPSLGVRSLFADRSRSRAATPPPPVWLNPDLIQRLDLKARWDRVVAGEKPAHPVRPEAYQGLADKAWPYTFGLLDPGCNGEAREYRHPFFDVRLVRYLLAMPRQPWFERKALLREAMKERLPEAVRRRPKTSLRGDPKHAVAPTFDRCCRERLLSAPGLAPFVDKKAVPEHIWDRPVLASSEYYGNIRAFSLGYWLSYCRLPSPDPLVRGTR